MRAVCERQAIVWDAIERMAFRPLTDNDRNRWLSEYERSLFRLWGLQPTDIQTRRNRGFDADFLNLACDYGIEASDRCSVTIVNVAAGAPACWHLHVDPGYRSRSSFYRPDEDYPRQDEHRHLANDVESVLDGMLFHPRNHAHGSALGIVSQLAPGAPSLGPSEIRLGGGIENAFVFLAHLRYQFCLLSEAARQAERTRLVQLFATAIRARRDTVPAAELLDFRERR
jgi:hypothetical protein